MRSKGVSTRSSYSRIVHRKVASPRRRSVNSAAYLTDSVRDLGRRALACRRSLHVTSCPGASALAGHGVPCCQTGSVSFHVNYYDEGRYGDGERQDTSEDREASAH